MDQVGIWCVCSDSTGLSHLIRRKQCIGPDILRHGPGRQFPCFALPLVCIPGSSTDIILYVLCVDFMTPQHPWTVAVSAVYCSLLEFCYFWVKSRAKRAGVAARRTVAVFAVSCSILQFCYFLVERVLTVQVLLAAAHLFFIGHTSSFHT